MKARGSRKVAFGEARSERAADESRKERAKKDKPIWMGITPAEFGGGSVR